jgi:aminoglycoside phosphotransferase (APT) family kinase protein
MAEAWSAEQHVDEQCARQLIRTRFEEPAADEVQLVSEGWDYAVFRVDGEWAFRFPRREAVISGTEREIAVLPALVAAAHELPPARHTAVCHGDLHMRQLLVAGEALTGIVDWVDVCRSDPAVDLSVAWSTLDEAGRASFFTAYGEAAEETRVRARVVAAYLCAMLAEWAAKEHAPPVLDAAGAGLERAIDEE